MVNLIRLFLDMTFEEKKVKIGQDKIIVDKNYQAEFKIGTSVFRERLVSPLMFWKKRRNLLLLVDGNPYAMHLEGGNPHPALAFNFGTMKETTEFIARTVAKSKADQKPISTWQFVILAGLMAGSIAIGLMIMRGVKL